MKRIVESSREIAIICHHNADPDALGSAYALQKLLHRLSKSIRTKVIAPGGISEISKRVINDIGGKYNSEKESKRSDSYFLVDTNTIQQLNDWKNRIQNANKPVIVIDHHAPHPETKKIASISFINAKSTSTCEIIFQLYKIMKKRIDRKCAQALLIGMAYDSGHFTIATSETFQIAASLIQFGANLEEAIALLRNPMSDSERIARLKAAKRIEFRKYDKWIVGSTKISSHQASVARGFLDLGTHLAIAAGERKGKLRISMRSRKEFNRKTNIHLGKDLAKPLAEVFHGMGGGHESAAGANGIGEVDKALSKFYEMISELIGNR